FIFFFSSRRRHTRSKRDWSSDVCSSDLSSFIHTPCQYKNDILFSSTSFIDKLITNYSTVDSFYLQHMENVDKCRKPIAPCYLFWYYYYAYTCVKLFSLLYLLTDCG